MAKGQNAVRKKKKQTSSLFPEGIKTAVLKFKSKQLALKKKMLSSVTVSEMHLMLL